jgi:hypothetical protein
MTEVEIAKKKVCIFITYIVQPVSLYLTSEKDLDQLLKNEWERVRVMAVCFIDGGNRSVRRKLFVNLISDFKLVHLFNFVCIYRGRCGRGRMVAGFTTTYAISAYYH